MSSVALEAVLAKLYTDEATPYKSLGKYYDHDFVNHSEEQYVKGEAHTNTIENYWCNRAPYLCTTR